MPDFKSVITDIKTVVGLIVVVLGLITYVLVLEDKIGDMQTAQKNWLLVFDQRFQKIERFMESIDEAVGWNRNYIMNMKMPNEMRATEIK